MLTHATEGEGSGEPTKPQPTPSLTPPSIGDQPPKTSPSHATTQDSRDFLEETNRNEGDQESSILCTNLSNRVLALESIKDAQAAEISALKIRIKKLEKKCKPSISHHRAWLKNHGIEYMETEEAMDEGRQSGETEEVKLTDDTEVVEDKGSCDKGGNAEKLVSTARPEVSAARPYIDDARQEDSAVEPRTPHTTTKIARQLQEDLQAEVERERQWEKEASKAAIAEIYDEVQAGIDADALFAAKLQQEEREEYTIEERAKFLAEIIATQRKFRAAQRSAEIRSADKSKITRKQSKSSKPGHENQKSTKPKPRNVKPSQSPSPLPNSSHNNPQGPFLHFSKVIYNLKERKERQGPNV
ncbi:hypothetical protein Tco_1307710 [Tanacetum coccineum]